MAHCPQGMSALTQARQSAPPGLVWLVTCGHDDDMRRAPFPVVDSDSSRVFSCVTRRASFVSGFVRVGRFVSCGSCGSQIVFVLLVDGVLVSYWPSGVLECPLRATCNDHVRRCRSVVAQVLSLVECRAAFRQRARGVSKVGASDVFVNTFAQLLGLRFIVCLPIAALVLSELFLKCKD